KEDPVDLVIGPVAQMPIDKRAAGSILRRMGESGSRAAELQNYFSTIVAYPLRNFLQVLCTVHFFINGEKLDVGRLMLGSEALPAIQPPPQEAPDPSRIRNTVELEQQMLSCVEYGKADQILELFRQPIEGRPGILAADALRQQKNLIICTATLVSRAAVRGGLDLQTAFALSDQYIQKAELLQRYEELVRLNAQMVLDFTRRVASLKNGINDSALVRRGREYILTHIGEQITTEALSRELGLNRTYLCSLFVRETGMTINSFVTQVKMEEARRLLDITSKSIAQIAAQLGYSTQSYFQKVFKKHWGITPGEYRRTGRGVRPLHK
ncbi:MAG: helix-turn-helix domain-containing protein, partial [Clostridia bacterium]|nr:helix-turn-helix domain-containing protein [Clostridia bacterium]